MARSRAVRRPLSGILLLDKPSGVTSNQALQQVKRLFRAAKAGHTGSLDPAASGLLPICMGSATKVSGLLLDADKRYRVVVSLGVCTTTGDAEGDVIAEKAVPRLSESDVASLLGRFRGEIFQVPPMFSALKRNGVRLYDLARQGIEVHREARKVTIHALELLAVNRSELELDVLCSKGTYIRTLAEDIGTMIGCGAHVGSLRRSQVGEFDVGMARTLDQLQNMASDAERCRCLLPPDKAVAFWPGLHLSDELAEALRNGRAVASPGAACPGWVRLYTADDAFVGIGEILSNGTIAPRRLF